MGSAESLAITVRQRTGLLIAGINDAAAVSALATTPRRILKFDGPSAVVRALTR